MLTQTRITPAGAGKRKRFRRRPRRSWDHPRRCGEKGCSHAHAAIPYGSPPQVRGKVLAVRRHKGQRGITPAGAGKSWILFALCCISWDHPRRCGEKCAFGCANSRGTGSPPQVRGKELPLFQARPDLRITPAGAGKSGAITDHDFRHRDHPRRCGEKTKRIPILGRFLLAAVQISFSFK